MLRPWFIDLIAAPPERTGTAIEAALFRAVERALFNSRHELHRQVFDYYREPDARDHVRYPRRLLRRAP